MTSTPPNVNGQLGRGGQGPATQPDTAPTTGSIPTATCPPLGTLFRGWYLTVEEGGVFHFLVIISDDISGLASLPESLRSTYSRGPVTLSALQSKNATELFSELHSLRTNPISPKTAYGTVRMTQKDQEIHRLLHDGEILAYEWTLQTESGVTLNHEQKEPPINTLSESEQRLIEQFDELAKYEADKRCLDALHQLYTKPQ